MTPSGSTEDNESITGIAEKQVAGFMSG
jgi:hypothetical protein